jgi:hypothetical protein
MESDPVARAEVEAENSPPTSDPEPRITFPFLMDTVPVGEPASGMLAVTLAANVTNCP